MASMRNRILKTLALAFCLFATNAVAQTTGAVVSISSAPTVGGACYTGMAIYVVQSTGDHYTCVGGVWVQLPLGGAGFTGDVDVSDCDWVWDMNGVPSFRLVGDGCGVTKFYIGDNSGFDYSFFTTTTFFGYTGWAAQSYGTNVLLPDSDNSGGDNKVELWTNWTGGSPYAAFRFQGTTLTFEGAADDTNQVDFTPEVPLSGTTTVTVGSKSGGLVVSAAAPASQPTSKCAEWDANGKLGAAAGTCGTGGGDDVFVDGFAISGANFISSADLDFQGNSTPSPNTVTAVFFNGSVESSVIQDNAVAFNDLNNIVFTDSGTSKLIDMSAVNMSVTNEGLRIPSSTDCQQSTATYSEGTICWESDTNILWVADGDSQPNDWTQVGGGGDVTDVFDCGGPDCNVITMTSGDSLRANTAGVIGLQESSVNMTDGTTACSSAQIGDMRVDFVGDPNNPELYVCTETAPGFWWFQLFSGVVGQTGVETREDGGQGNTGQGVLDFKSGFDITPASGGVTEIRFDISELTLTHSTLPTPDEYGIWMSGALTDNTPAVCPPDTEDTVIQIPIPVCYGANEKLSFHPAVDFSGCADDEEAYWTCDGFSTSSVAQSVDVDGVTVGDGVDPEIYVNDGYDAIYLNPAGGTGVSAYEWKISKSGTVNRIEPRVATNSYMHACHFDPPQTGTCDLGVTTMGADDDADGTNNAWLELSSDGLKLFLGEGSTTPSMALVTGGIDADNDGIADNLSANGLNKSMPNYSESFTSQTSVTMTHDLRSANLVTVCYDGSDNQITPASVSIGSAPTYDVMVTFSGSTTGRCVINGGTNSKYTTSFSNQLAVVVDNDDLGMDPYAAHVTCYDDADPRNRVEPDSVQIDDTTLDMTINFAVGQSGRCVVS